MGAGILRTPSRARVVRCCAPQRAHIAILAFLGTLLCIGTADAEVELPRGNSTDPIQIRADSGVSWKEGTREVWVLHGNCRIEQGRNVARSADAVLWVEHVASNDPRPGSVVAYLEGDVQLTSQENTSAKLTDRQWVGRFETQGMINVRAIRVEPVGETLPPIYARAADGRRNDISREIRRTQYGESAPDPFAATTAPAPGSLAASGAAAPGSAVAPEMRRVRVRSRSDVGVEAQWTRDRQTNEWTAVIGGGVTLLIEGLALPKGNALSAMGGQELGTIDISTDRIIIWTTGMEELDLRGSRAHPSDLPLEIYMEGNVVFRQGDREIHADRMYYDVKNQIGTVVNAELSTTMPKIQGKVRLKAELLQQTAPNQFRARDASVTSSQLGFPAYRLQAGDVTFTDSKTPLTDPVTGEPIVDPETGRQKTRTQQLIESNNNFIFVDEVPIFYWPRMATDLNDSTYYLRRINLKHDNVMGTQILTDWNMYQLLGCTDRPDGTEWDASADYLSKRGFGHGSVFRYNRDEILGIPGRTAGMVDYWGIYDKGMDNLGADQRSILPERKYRYRFFTQHRQMLEGDVQLTGEIGWISDRNYLQEYLQNEWYNLKDETTGLELKKIRDNSSWSLSADARVNDFFTQTDWLPRFDHFLLGQSLFDDTFTWYEHTSVGYAQFHTLNAPGAAQNPNNTFRYLPWETSPTGSPINTQRERVVTRQEIDWPFQLGPVKLVPYALGEAAHWGEDLTGNDLQRLYGQAGIRASLPMWAVYNDVDSVFWNVHGLAHKVVFDAEFSYADASKDMNRLPLYDSLDDDSGEAFRRRFVPNTFAPGPGTGPAPAPAIPLRFDERYYAVRTGMAGQVTAPSMEIAEDLMAFRAGIHNRWQTKRGTPGYERIVDWLTLDTNLTLFPKGDRDNFGKSVGLFDYDARWQAGDRLAFLSSGSFDFFKDGQQIISVGAFLERPPQGSLYAGLYYLEGPIHNLVLATSYSYRLSQKWIASLGMSVDLSGQGNIGENIMLTRIGESFLVSASVNVDASRGSWGANLSVEPRFLQKSRLGNVGGARIPASGELGLE